MKIEMFKIEGRVCLLISPIIISVAERIGAAMENSEVVTALGAYLTPVGEAPAGEHVGLYLYFDHLDTAAFITLNHLIKADKPVPIVVR
ncbi:hypothetical protein SNN69_002924 [Cronobacter sakazakii]|nr:hypothetical protein [Cronobacter sakazakii]